MLDEMDTVTVAMNDEDGIPYVLPLSFGYEVKDNQLIVYTHFMKHGKKVDLLKKDSRVGLSFSIFNDL